MIPWVIEQLNKLVGVGLKAQSLTESDTEWVAHRDRGQSSHSTSKALTFCCADVTLANRCWLFLVLVSGFFARSGCWSLRHDLSENVITLLARNYNPMVGESMRNLRSKYEWRLLFQQTLFGNRCYHSDSIILESSKFFRFYVELSFHARGSARDDNCKV